MSQESPEDPPWDDEDDDEDAADEDAEAADELHVAGEREVLDNADADDPDAPWSTFGGEEEADDDDDDDDAFEFKEDVKDTSNHHLEKNEDAQVHTPPVRAAALPAAPLAATDVIPAASAAAAFAGAAALGHEGPDTLSTVDEQSATGGPPAQQKQQDASHAPPEPAAVKRSPSAESMGNATGAPTLPARNSRHSRASHRSRGSGRGPAIATDHAVHEALQEVPVRGDDATPPTSPSTAAAPAPSASEQQQHMTSNAHAAAARGRRKPFSRRASSMGGLLKGSLSGRPSRGAAAAARHGQDSRPAGADKGQDPASNCGRGAGGAVFSPSDSMTVSMRPDDQLGEDDEDGEFEALRGPRGGGGADVASSISDGLLRYGLPLVVHSVVVCSAVSFDYFYGASLQMLVETCGPSSLAVRGCQSRWHFLEESLLMRPLQLDRKSGTFGTATLVNGTVPPSRDCMMGENLIHLGDTCGEVASWYADIGYFTEIIIMLWAKLVANLLWSYSIAYRFLNKHPAILLFCLMNGILMAGIFLSTEEGSRERIAALPLLILGTEAVCLVLVTCEPASGGSRCGSSFGHKAFFCALVIGDFAIGGLMAYMAWLLSLEAEDYVAQRDKATKLLWTLRGLAALVLKLYTWCYWLAEDMRGRLQESKLTTARIGVRRLERAVFYVGVYAAMVGAMVRSDLMRKIFLSIGGPVALLRLYAASLQGPAAHDDNK
eukprot:TRINITY_DN3777_c0_g1_i1.p1 TRINITY_DN3777_c0_g1~~TRINITY_DN3777_c0_g1_i1.p1  ORF type:complete len:718 (-),score=163.01 TRINITY_DN3777_c0_g1_i1:199-2352(-)